MAVKYKILVVDDIEMNRDLLSKIFSNDYTVLLAKDGLEALNLLKSNEVNLVLLDLEMPNMNGYEVISAMKEDQLLASIPIVVETGAIDKSECKALELGADDFIVKPYDSYVIRRRVENLISKYVLQMDNLSQALRQAEELNKSKSDFLSRMSHDLRSPINSVISLATLQKDEVSNPEKITEYSDKIISSARYLLGVINDVLDMSAIENQKLVITRTPFDFKKQIELIATLFYGQCREKNISFNLNLQNFTEEFLFGDPMRLKEILVNLISNAIEYTPSGGSITVKVSQLSRISSMVKLRFEVIDTGEGIDKNRLEIIFKPFTQEHISTKGKHGGSGLGLSIVKNIVELMGGKIFVESEKGKGSSFTVDLPFIVSKEMPKIDNQKLKNVRALIIDDDVDTQNYGSKMMNKMGIKTDVAFSGEEALRKMNVAFNKSEGYDICFVDWKMPGMSGVEITEEIRKRFSDDTVIVVASAYDLSEIEQTAKMSGANVVVPKPMFQSTVFDLLMNMTGGQYNNPDNIIHDYNFNGKTALVAEDNALNAEVLIELLNISGFKTVRAIDGKDVCEKFEKSPTGTFDVILMDVQMPFQSGLEATKEIRKSMHPQAKSIPIVAVTANAFIEDVKASLNSGMNAHVAKPIDSNRLYETLDNLLNKNK